MSRENVAVLFDLDGTLIDSIALIEHSYRHTLRTHVGEAQGGDGFDRDEWLEGLGRPLAWQFQRWTKDPEEVRRWTETYRAFNNRHHDEWVRAYPGAVEAVRRLRERGVRLGVVTSKLAAGAQRGLARGGFDGLFDAVIGCDDVREPKPAAEPALLALARLDVDASNAFMVGDSPHDIRCGRSAGTRTAAVAWGPFPRHWFGADAPDRWLAETSEIERLV